MRTLRADNLKLTDDLSRLKEKQAEAQRKLDIAEGSEASLKTQLKTAEATIRALKEDMARHRTLVAQARTSCATEVRRRDRQIDTLKKQLGEAGRARGSRGNPGVTTITVTGDFGADKPDARASAGEVAEYNLRSETNAFLADLARNLSEENEAITTAMRQTIEKLRQMSGWTNEDDSDRADPRVTKHPGWDDMASDLNSVLDHMKVILTNPSFVPIEEVEMREEEIARLKSGWVKMEDRWKEAVHLMDGWRKRMAASGRPIDDEELKMGLRLSPVRVRNVEETRQAQLFDLSAVAEEEEEEEEEIMQDEREQGEATHPDIDVEEGDEDEEMMNSGLASPCPMREESLELVPAPEVVAQDSAFGRYDENGFYEDDEDENNEDNWKREGETDEEEPNVEVLQESTGTHAWDRSPKSSPLPEPPQLSPLRQSPSAANRRPQNSGKKQKPDAPSNVAKENRREPPTHDDKPPQPPPHRTKLAKPAARSLARPPRQVERPRSPSRTSLEEALLPRRRDENESGQQDDAAAEKLSHPAYNDEEEDELAAAPQETPRRVGSRLPLPRNPEPAPEQSPLTMATIAAKLAASEREADAARVRAKLKAVRGTRGVKRPTPGDDQPPQPMSKSPRQEPSRSQDALPRRRKDEDIDPVKRDLQQSQGEEVGIKVEKRKRDKTTKATSRRRSTLSPWELESLISGNVQ
jgi:hypothetical protein